LLDYPTAAAMLGISTSYLKKLADQRKVGYVLRKFRFGVYVRRQRLFPLSEVLAYQVHRLQRVYGSVLTGLLSDRRVEP
jgi:hypothetical protein